MLAKACATLAVIGTAAAYTPTLVSIMLYLFKQDALQLHDYVLY